MNVFVKKLYGILIICMAVLTACKQESSLYIISDQRYVAGQKRQVIDIRADNSRFSITDGEPVVLMMGIGGDANVEPHHKPRETMCLEIRAEWCTINGAKELYRKEYPDYFTNDKYRPRTEGTGDNICRFPQYTEPLEIVFPSGECYGAIFFLLSDGVNGTQGEGSDSTTLTVYYAKNDKLVVFSEHLILVDDIS